jgi:hypothetical protein
MTEMTLTRSALNRATLARQMLLAREKTDALSAIARLLAMQAQEARPPYLGLWTRLVGFRAADLTQLLLERQVVRATAMRGTLHLMATDDYLALRETLQPMLSEAVKSVLRTRAEGLDFDAVVAEGSAFFGERSRTFEEFREQLERAHPGGDARAMAYAVRLSLPLVQVPAMTDWGFPARTQFALAETWLEKMVDTLARPETLVRRYLAAYGPATVSDAQAWSGMKGLSAAFEALRPELVTFLSEEGKELFDVPDAPRPSEETLAPVRFLPEFDNLLLAHADRRRIIADDHRKRIVTPNLRVLPTFLVVGLVAGTWRLEQKKKSATLTIEPFEPLPVRVQAELAEEGARLVEFLAAGCPPEVRLA